MGIIAALNARTLAKKGNDLAERVRKNFWGTGRGLGSDAELNGVERKWEVVLKACDLEGLQRVAIERRTVRDRRRGAGHLA